MQWLLFYVLYDELKCQMKTAQGLFFDEFLGDLYIIALDLDEINA